jgi:hypothetical protein
MTFKKGDRVKFLNDIGGGIITRVDRKTIYVENDDGFEIPIAESQLLPAQVSQAGNSPFAASRPSFDEKNGTDAVRNVYVPEYIDLTDSPDESDVDTSLSILLAWTAQRKKHGEAGYELHLVNDCSYHIMYVAAMISNGAYRGIQAGMLERDTSINLTQISAGDLKQIDSIRLELLFFKKGAYMPQEPMRYELKTDGFYLTDAGNYAANEYFDEKALIYNITEEYLMAEIENVAQEAQMQLIEQKQRIDRPIPKPAGKSPENDTEEVDLHIEQLVERPKAFTPAEMLNIQMERFSAALEEAVRNRTKRIVFIHGVGNGRLRLEIQRTLDRRYPKLRYQDASFKEYGYGATMVIIGK